VFSTRSASRGNKRDRVYSLVVEYSPAGKDVSKGHFRIRYQETTSEDTECFMCVAVTVIFRACTLRVVRLLVLLVVTSCLYKCSINPKTNLNPVLVTSCDNMLARTSCS
jgi:hypothetical protein